MKDHRCNCDASCGENRYHDAGDHGCRFQDAEEFEAYWQNIRDQNEKWYQNTMKKEQEKKHKDKTPAADPYTGPVYTIENEVKRLRDALSTIGALFEQMPTTKEVNVIIAWDIVDGALNGTWPAYGIVPAKARNYRPKDDTRTG